MKGFKLPNWVIVILKALGGFSSFFFVFICYDCFDSWDPYFGEYYAMIGNYFEELDIPYITPFYTAFFKYSRIVIKKFLDILAAFIWYWVDVQMTFKHYSMMGISTAICLIIEIYVESPKKDYFFVLCFILGVIWVCYYFW